MAYFVHLLDKNGRFEIIDGEFLSLYCENETDLDLVELTTKQYQDYLDNSDDNTRFIKGEFVFTKIEQEYDEQAELAARKFTLMTQLATKTDQLKSQVLTGYPQTEIDSFYRQEREAREWLADNRTPTPMLSSIAENRGVPLAILIEKVVEKADQLAGIMGAILGQKQALEDRLQAVENPQKIAEIAEEIEQWQLSI